MIRTFLHIGVPAELGAEVIERYARLRVLENSVRLAGALSCEILQNTEDGSVMVLALWQNETDYRSWRSHPEREHITRELADLIQLSHATAYELRAVVTG